MCLMIDEEVLHSIRDAAEPTREWDDNGKCNDVHPFIKAVNLFPSIPEVTETDA